MPPRALMNGLRQFWHFTAAFRMRALAMYLACASGDRWLPSSKVYSAKKRSAS
ncbi:MAG: hypothetical protein IKN99_06350 [Bacteroidales bacterium]|nr:hypothetical protein [Bacteroidales bacterium]